MGHCNSFLTPFILYPSTLPPYLSDFALVHYCAPLHLASLSYIRCVPHTDWIPYQALTLTYVLLELPQLVHDKTHSGVYHWCGSGCVPVFPFFSRRCHIGKIAPSHYPPPPLPWSALMLLSLLEVGAIKSTSNRETLIHLFSTQRPSNLRGLSSYPWH